MTVRSTVRQTTVRQTTVRQTTVRRAARTLAALACVLAAVGVAAPAGAAGSGSGWLRLAYLSPNTPPVDVYLYSFGNPRAFIVLHHVAYGTVSPYQRVASGDYTVAMRGLGAAPTSRPVLSATVDVVAGKAYTVAGMGPFTALRLEVMRDRLNTPPGKALVRVIEASLRQGRATVTIGRDRVTYGLAFGRSTGYEAVAPGTWTMQAAGPTRDATARIRLTAGSIRTVVLLDEPGRLALHTLTDAVGSTRAPRGGVATGLGGTAARPDPSLVPWLATMAFGLALLLTGLATRRRRGLMS
jgi:uncharacterized protein DUF4397